MTSIITIPHEAIKAERRRGNQNAFTALLITLAAGWTYAQLARLLGAPPSLIGLTAIGVQFITFICAMNSRIGEHVCRGRGK